MNISLLIIVLFVILLLLANGKILFTQTGPEQDYLNETKDLQNVIGTILNDTNYKILMDNVPGQKIYNIVGNPPTLESSILQGDPSKVEEISSKFPELLEKTNKLIDSLTQFILIAENTNGVYTPEKMKTFVVYYTNVLNNAIIIKKYLEK